MTGGSGWRRISSGTDRGFMAAAPLDLGSNGRLYTASDRLCKYASIKEGSVCEPKRVVNMRGISSCTERKPGEIEMGLSSENYETSTSFR